MEMREKRFPLWYVFNKHLIIIKILFKVGLHESLLNYQTETNSHLLACII
jgi:hypothetical protein